MDAVLETRKIKPTIEFQQSKNNGEPKTVRWTRNEYYKMAELGFFRGKRVELIKGEIVVMSPMKSAHATAISLANEVLSEVFGKNFVVRTQLPMSLGKTNEPEPDVSVVEGKVRDFSQAHPKTAALVVEISETTLNYDRTTKASLYAENKIPDYWILNLKNRCLEIYRQPIRDKKLGFVYSEIRILTENDTATPLARPDAKVKVADLLP